MFFLFGWGTQTDKFEGQTEPKLCEVCGEESTWDLYRSSKWITFFFVPSLPYDMKWQHVCPECGYQFEVEGEIRSRLLKIARLNRALQKGKIQRGQYEMEMAKLRREHTSR